MKQTVKLKESQLRDIVRESLKGVLKEKYASPPFKDLDAQWNNAYDATEKYPVNGVIINDINDASGEINAACVEVLGGDKSNPFYKYAEAINKKVFEIENILYRYSLQTTQKLGLQPFYGSNYTEHDDTNIKNDFDGNLKNWAKRTGRYR